MLLRAPHRVSSHRLFLAAWPIAHYHGPRCLGRQVSTVEVQTDCSSRSRFRFDAHGWHAARPGLLQEEAPLDCQNAEQLWKEGKVFAWPAWTPCRWFSFVCSHPGSIVEAAGALVDTASRRIGREALASNDDNLAKPSTVGWKLRTRLSCSWRRIRPTTTTIACGVWEDHQDS